MLKNYIIIALRNIRRYKAYSFINIFGLSIGLACCLFIALWILDEVSFDTFHAEADQIYQALGNGRISSTPIPLAPALKQKFPEIIYTSRYEGLGEPLFRRGYTVFYEDAVVALDPDFFKIFSFPFLRGDPGSVMPDKYSIVISEQVANKFFPNEDPLGKTLTMNDEIDFTVSGVMQNTPLNSTIQFDIAIHFDLRIAQAIALGADPNSWGFWSPKTYIKLREDVSTVDINQKISGFFQSQFEEEDEWLSLLPLKDRRFFFWETNQYINIFSGIAVFILFVACINFINLSTARSANRAREIGLRKVAGAFRTNLIIQFLGESFIITMIAFIIALFIVSTFLPLFNAITGKQITTDYLDQPVIILIFIGLTLLTGIVSGSYPALVLSSLRPVQVLKGKLDSGSSAFLFRKILVVFQFSISIILITGTLVVFNQLHYIKTKDIGYDKDQLLTISLKGESRKSYDVIKNRLTSDARILGVTGMADDLPHFGSTSNTAEWEGRDQTKEIQVGFNFVDYDIVKTLGLELVDGRDFSRAFMGDVESGYLVNEELVKIMNLESVVGRPFKEFGKAGKIIGIFRNTHFLPLTNHINPLYFQLNPDRVNHMVIRVPAGNMQETLQFIKETWEEIIPLYPFEYRFVDQEFDKVYTNIERMGSLANVFTAIAIFIACLGLFGLASFTTVQRTKEIGIRKVLGASVPNILGLLSKEFIILVILSNLIAWPLAYFGIEKWLQNFAYHIDLSWFYFVISGLAALLITIIVVSSQSLKVAFKNPAGSLRYE